jgi:aryl-alcohol dehydrogenase-like predicted oxidoreductase
MINWERICWGTAQLGLDYGISNSLGKTSKSEGLKIQENLESKDSYFVDTSSLYGDSESVLGDIINKKNKIISKYKNLQSINLKNQIRKSLDNLNTKSLYAILSHDPKEILSNPSLWEDFLKVKKDKLTSKIGFSLYDEKDFEKIIKLNLKFDVVQVPLNYFDKRFDSIIKYCNENSIEVQIRSVFLQGIFFKEMNLIPSFFDPLKKEITQLQNIYGKNLGKFLVEYVFLNYQIDLVIIGFNNQEQLKELIDSENIDFSNFKRKFNAAIDNNIINPIKWPK